MTISSEEWRNKPSGCWRVMAPVLGVLVVVGAVLVLWRLAQPAREASRRSSCKGQLKIFGLALHNYHDVYRSFPPAYIADKNGRPMHSWRVLPLPFLAEPALYERYRFNEAWNSPHNRTLADGLPIGMSGIVPMYHCASDRNSDPLHTSFVVVVGPDTIYPGSATRRIKDITDGSSNTVVVAEMAESGIHWMEPRDLDFNAMSFRVNDPRGKCIRSKHTGVAHVLLADGSVRAISEDIDPQVLKGMLTIAGGELVPPF